MTSCFGSLSLLNSKVLIMGNFQTGFLLNANGEIDDSDETERNANTNLHIFAAVLGPGKSVHGDLQQLGLHQWTYVSRSQDCTAQSRFMCWKDVIFQGSSRMLLRAPTFRIECKNNHPRATRCPSSSHGSLQHQTYPRQYLNLAPKHECMLPGLLKFSYLDCR